jgi:6-phosphogluconolactonase
LDLYLKFFKHITFHRIQSWLDPHIAAKKYENVIIEEIPIVNFIPQLDLIFLGFGVDGHIASLFPSSALLKEDKKYIASTPVKHNGTYRITMTYPLLNNARYRLVALKGKKKISIFNKAIKNKSEKALYPILGLSNNTTSSVIAICQK